MPVYKRLSINKNQSENSEANDSNEIDTESDSETEYANSQLQTNHQNSEVNSETNNLLKPSETRSPQTSQENKKQNLNQIKHRTEIQYKINKEDPWKTATIVSRGGKATGKYRHQWNTTNQNGEKATTDFASVHKWETLPTT